MIRKGTYLLLLFLLSLSFSSFAASYEIRLKVNGLHDTTVILGHYLNKSMYPDDTIRLNNKGMGMFTGIQPFTRGYVPDLPSQYQVF